MIKSVLQPLFSALFNFNYLFLPQKTDEQIKKGEETNQTTEAWERYLQEAKRRAEKELEERKKAGESILQKVGMGTTLSPVKTQPSLSPIDWDHPRGKLESSADSVKEELLRTVYFSKMAETALSNGDLEAARFWATFAFEGPSISPRDIDYKPPKELINAMDSRKAVEMSRRLAQNSRLFKEVLPKFDVLQETIAKMEEIKIKREISEKRLKEVEEEIKRMELQKKTAQTPTEKNELDDLLRRTIALKHEIDAEYQKVLDDEQKLIRQKEVIEKELNELKMRFTEVMR
ncbi:MAG: hypothetical protein RMJ39_03345 [Deltaproteobacteria bacterium]|nr:hypothetical protein [Deltaproteobacteria bacterium]